MVVISTCQPRPGSMRTKAARALGSSGLLLQDPSPNVTLSQFVPLRWPTSHCSPRDAEIVESLFGARSATCLHILYSEHATVGVDTYHEIHDCTPLLPRSLERKTRANHLLPGSHVLKHWWPEGDRARRSLRPRPRSRPRPEFPSPSASAVAPSGLHSGMIRVPRHVQAVTMSASSCAPSREVLRRSPIRLGGITFRLNDPADPSRHHLDRGEGAQIEVVVRVCRAHSVAQGSEFVHCPIRDSDSVTQEIKDGCAFGVDIWAQTNI